MSTCAKCLALATVLSALLTLQPVQAEERPVGFLRLPEAPKIGVQRVGTPLPVVVGEEQGEVWYPEERYRRKVQEFGVFSAPSDSAEKLGDFDTSGAWMDIVAESAPGEVRLQGQNALRNYRLGQRKLVVFERKGEWLRIRFRDQPPWNGRMGWVKMGPNTGSFSAK